MSSRMYHVSFNDRDMIGTFVLMIGTFVLITIL